MDMRRKSEADIAVEILMERKEPLFYQELIREVSKRLGIEYTEQEMVEVYTRLNMDNRLEYKGEGMWYFVSNRTYRDTTEEE